MSPDTTCRPGTVIGRLACVALLLGLLSGCGKTAGEYYIEARVAGSLKKEAELLSLALDKDPGFKDARMRRAWIYAMRRQLDEALKDYDLLQQQMVKRHEEALAKFEALPAEKKKRLPKRRASIQNRLRQDVAFVLHGRAQALELNGRFAEAIKDYTSTLNHNPTILDVYAGRGSTYFKMGRYTESMRDYGTLLDRDINRTGREALARRGERHLRRAFAAVCAGEWIEAAKDFQAATTILPSSHRRTRAFLGLYFVACRVGSKTDADRELLADAQQTRKLHKGLARPNTWIFRAEWHAAGLIDMRQFLLESRHPDKRITAERLARAHYYIGARLLVNGNKKGAQDAFATCIALNNPALPEHHLAKVELERLAAGGKTAGEYVALAKKERDRVKQIELFTKALGVDPNHAEARRNRGILFAITGACDRAVDDFTRLLALCTSPVEKAAALRYRGFAHSRKGDHIAALRDYHAAAQAYPKLWQAHEGLARSLAALRRYDEAAAIYTALIKQAAWTEFRPVWHAEKAFTVMCAGKWKEAAADWQTVMKDDDSPLVRANLYIAQCRAGDKDGATKALKAYVAGMKRPDWQGAAARYLADRIDEKAFLQLSQHSDKAVQAARTSRAQYYIGSSNLIRGSKPKAGEAFNKCVRAGSTQKQESWEYRMALAELRRVSDWR